MKVGKNTCLCIRRKQWRPNNLFYVKKTRARRSRDGPSFAQLLHRLRPHRRLRPLRLQTPVRYHTIIVFRKRPGARALPRAFIHLGTLSSGRKYVCKDIVFVRRSQRSGTSRKRLPKTTIGDRFNIAQVFISTHTVYVRTNVVWKPHSLGYRKTVQNFDLKTIHFFFFYILSDVENVLFYNVQSPIVCFYIFLVFTLTYRAVETHTYV